MHGLYAITDEHRIAPARFDDTVAQLLAGGARIVQYRDKSRDKARRLAQARALRRLTREYDACLIINDDIELCRQVEADGVHLGKNDAAIATARARLGEAAIIGASCYDSLSLAARAKAAGASYLAFGALFPSPTKPGAVAAPLSLLAEAKARFALPVCAIGGIDAENAARVIAAGADMVAVISALYHDRAPVREHAARIARCFTGD